MRNDKDEWGNRPPTPGVGAYTPPPRRPSGWARLVCRAVAVGLAGTGLALLWTALALAIEAILAGPSP